MNTSISHLMPLESYREPRALLFPSEQSLRWFVRVHRQGLIRAQALFKLRGRPHVHADNFDRYVMAAAAAGVAQEA